MLFGFWQLKTTVFALLLASSLGHALLRTCQRDYCYERSIERRNIETDNLRKLYSDESRRADIARETRILENISRGLRENPLDQFDSESNREIRRELQTISENRRELVRHDPSRRESYQDLIKVHNGRSTADINDFNRRVEKAPEIQRSAILERRQETNTNRFRTPTSRLNERENRRNTNELHNENQEPHRFNERLSLRQLEVFQRSEESQTEREIIDRQSRSSSDRIIESERNLLERRERNPEDQVNRDSRRSDAQTSDRNTESLQRHHQIKEESNTINEILTRSKQENNRDVARRESENSEGKRFNEQLSERDNEIRYENLRREREHDDNMEKFRRRERNLEERVNRESNRSDKHKTNRNLEAVQSRYQINEENNIINEVLTRRENNRDVARRESESFETKRFNERVSERTNEIRFENNRNMEKSRQISVTENNLLDRYDRRQDERERNNHRFNENGRTQELIQRREGSSQERDNSLEEMQRSSSRLDLTETFIEQRKSLENHHSIEELSERRQEAMQRRDINRRERIDNRVFERSNSPLSAHENERSNEQLSNVEDRSERQNDFKTFDESRESRKPSRRIIEREERNVQRRIANDMERERNTERNVRDNEKNRRITSRQDNHEHRYDINKRFTERENTQRRIGDSRNREINSRQPGIPQQEQRLEVINRSGEQRNEVEFNRRQQLRYDNSPERENVLNRNRNSQRFSGRLLVADEENIDNRDENYEAVSRIKNSRRSEQRNIARLADENRNSRHIDERREENGISNPASRRPSFSENERESVEQLDTSDRKFETRQEELRELDERVDQREINRASDRNVGEIHQSRERISENIRERDNHNLDERKLQHETTRRLVTRRSNERQDRIGSTRSNHQMVLRKGETTKLQQRRDENKQEQREERENQRLDTLAYRTVENRRDFQFIVDEYKKTPTDSLKNSNLAYVQGVLLAIIVMKTFNGKNNIKCQVSQKFQEAIAMLGF